MYQPLQIKANPSQVETALSYVENVLQKEKVQGKAWVRAKLVAEESILYVINNTRADSDLHLSIKKHLGKTYLVLESEGDELTFTPDLGIDTEGDSGLKSKLREGAINSLLLHSYSDYVRYKRTNGINTIQVTLKISERKNLYLTLGSLVAAIIFGLILRMMPEAVSTGLLTYVLKPVKTVYMNALSCMIGPVVFFSVVTSISQFENLKELGRIGAKVMGLYLLTTCLAILIGIGTFLLFKPGDPSIAPLVSNSADALISTAKSTDISILNTIINIVPKNIVSPFQNSDMLQLIFLAILFGVSVGMIGDYSKPLKDLFDACNKLFLQVTTLIIRLIPVAVFSSITTLVVTSGVRALISVLTFFGTFLVGICILISAYSLLILLFGRLNPLVFLKKYAPDMLTTFSMGSSNAAIPYSIKACTNLGISTKVSSFSIPLGSTVNMDGSSVYMIIAGLFLSRVFGVQLTASDISMMIFETLVLSVGAPGIPGSGLVCLSVLLAQIGVPAEALSLVMGIDALIGMVRSMSNTCGDISVSLIVATRENMLDTKKYYS